MEREKEALKEWAKTNGLNGFAWQEQESYWLKREDQIYLQEWNFENVQEVQFLLEQLEISTDKPEVFKEIQKTVMISVMKGRQRNQEAGAAKRVEDVSLPEYIYVF